MSPAFSAPQLRSFLTLFQDIGLKVGMFDKSVADLIILSQMCERWKTEVVDGSGKTTFVNKWLAGATLDIIGQGKEFQHGRSGHILNFHV